MNYLLTYSNKINFYQLFLSKSIRRGIGDQLESSLVGSSYSYLRIAAGLETADSVVIAFDFNFSFQTEEG